MRLFVTCGGNLLPRAEGFIGLLFITDRKLAREVDRCGIGCNMGVVADCRGEEGPEPEGEGLDLHVPVNLCHSPHVSYGHELASLYT